MIRWLGTQAAGLFVAGPIVFSGWLFVVATPLTIERISADRDMVGAGDWITVTSEAKKPKWAARFCRAQSSTLFMQDRAGQLVQFEEAFGFNDGSMKGVLTRVRVPRSLEVGRITVWKRVDYRCFGFHEIGVYSAKYPAFNLIDRKWDHADP